MVCFQSTIIFSFTTVIYITIILYFGFMWSTIVGFMVYLWINNCMCFGLKIFYESTINFFRVKEFSYYTPTPGPDSIYITIIIFIVWVVVLIYTLGITYAYPILIWVFCLYIMIWEDNKTAYVPWIGIFLLMCES